MLDKLKPATFVIFGASGGLTRRILVPALHTLGCDGFLPAASQVLGVHQVTSERYHFLDPVQLQPVRPSLADQLDYMLSFQVNSSHQVAEALAQRPNGQASSPTNAGPVR